MKKIVMFLILLPTVLTAQSAFPYQAETSLSQSETYIGQTVYLTFAIQTEEKPVLQPLRSVYGLELEYRGENVSTQMTTTIVNGRRDSKTVYHYRFTYAVTPKEAGVFIIPQTRITVGGTDYPTSPVKLTVKEIEKNSRFRLFLSSDCGDRAYHGQTVTLTVEMEISSDIDSLAIRIPFLKNAEILPAEAAGSSSGSDAGNVKINDEYYPFRRETAVRDRAVFSAKIRFAARLTDNRTAADCDFSEATATFRAVTATEESVDMFGRPVQNRRYSSVVIPAEGGQLKILPLPQPQPDDFSGIVGRPQFSASADMREAYVGDPVTYRLTVSGIDYLPSDLLPLDKIGSFTESFRIPEHHSPPLKENGTAVFVYTIRPLSDTVTEIPEYNCSVFNPETERYETVTAPALPLKVYPSPSMQVSQVEEFFQGPGEPEAVTLEEIKNRIPAAETGKKVLYRDYRFPYGTAARVLYVLLFAVTTVPLLCVSVIAVRRRRPSTVAIRRRELLKAVREARRLEDPRRIEYLLKLSEEYCDIVIVYPECGECVSRLKYFLFSGTRTDSRDVETVFDTIEEVLR